MAAVAGANARHNFLALGLDYACFLIGWSFASQTTILPAFATHLGAPNVVIGAIPAVLMLGWFLPSLFVAHYTETLPRKLPFVLRYTVWERLPFPALAALAIVLAEPAPRLALGVFLALLLVASGVGGALMPAWMDIMGRTIPVELRGRFFGAANLLASVGGLVGSAGTAYILVTFPAPRSYGLCFLAASIFLALSYVALASVREPTAAAPSVPMPLRVYLRGMPALLRRDRNLAWFIAARGFAVVGAMANGFYTVYALRAFGAPEWRVGLFTMLFLGGQTVGNLVLGWLADRAGHRLVIALGIAALMVGNLGALTAPSVEAFGPVFVLVGIHLAAIHVSARTIVLEFAPDERARPTYLGLANTALGPLSAGAPLAAGLLADRVGFPAVFATAAVFGLVGLALLLARVREPRTPRAGRAAAASA
jgi:MFS family permease